MEAETFVDEVLVKALGVREVVVGFNHTFGRGARGTAALLRDLGTGRGFVAHVLPPLQVNVLTGASSAFARAPARGGGRRPGPGAAGPAVFRDWNRTAGRGPGPHLGIPHREPQARPAPGAGRGRLRGPGPVGRSTGRCGGQYRLPADLRGVTVLDRGLPLRFLRRPVRPDADARFPRADPSRDEVLGRGGAQDR